MIDIEKEKKSALKAVDVHEICDLAMQAAEIEGFASSYDFERCLWAYAADVLYPDLQDEINEIIINDGALNAFTKLLEDGTLEKMVKEYASEIEQLQKAAETWYEDYVKYATSIRGTLNAFQTYSGGILDKQALQLFNLQNNPDFKNTYDIAEKWGMNNDSPADAGKDYFIAD